MRAGRLVSILILLQLRVRLTAEQLAEEFEVSVRTIYRDIEELSAAGVPIYGDRGPGGGFQLVDGYRTRLTGLGRDEAEAVFMIGVPGAADAIGLGAAAESAARKLLAALPPALSSDAGRLGARFHFDPVDWYREAETSPLLPALARAVLDQRMVTMTYESWTGVRTSTVEPFGLVFKAATWYLAARGGDTVRIYRVSNIRDAVVDERTFDRPTDFDLPSFWREGLQRFEASLRPSTAVVEALPAGLARLARAGTFAAAAVRAAAVSSDGWTRVELPIESVDQATLLLLGLGPDVRAVAPPELRARVHALAHDIARQHAPMEESA